MIMIVLLNHADDTGRAWPSQDRIAEQTGLKERAVRNHLNDLKQDGWIQVVSQVGRNHVYRVSTPAEYAGYAAENAGQPRHEMPVKDDEPRQNMPLTPANGAATPAEYAADPGKICRLSTHEQPNNQPLNQTSAEPPAKNGQEQKPAEPKRKPNSWRDEAKLKAQEANLTTLPLDLASDTEIVALWRSWCDHRTELAQREKTKPWTPRAAEMEIANIAKAVDQHGLEIVCVQIRTAISSSWQGLNLQNIRPQFGRKRYGEDHDDRPTGL